MGSSRKKQVKKKAAPKKKAVAKKKAPAKKAAARKGSAGTKRDTANKRNQQDMDKLRLIAQMMFVDNGLEQKLIASTLKVSENTISNWKLSGDWDTLREQAVVGPEQEMRRLRGMLTTHLDKFEKEKRFPDSGEADAIKKITSAIADLKQDQLDAAAKYHFCKELIKHTQAEFGQARTEDIIEILSTYLIK